MKNNKLHSNQRLNVRQDEKNLLYKPIKEIQETIHTRREDMKLLIAFAVGEKTLPRRRNKKFVNRTQEDDTCLLWSLHQLREQVQHLEKEILLLKEGAA